MVITGVTREAHISQLKVRREPPLEPKAPPGRAPRHAATNTREQAKQEAPPLNQVRAANQAAVIITAERDSAFAAHAGLDSDRVHALLHE